MNLSLENRFLKIFEGLEMSQFLTFITRLLKEINDKNFNK